jgi:chemotaxis signal transduction protein
MEDLIGATDIAHVQIDIPLASPESFPDSLMASDISHIPVAAAPVKLKLAQTIRCGQWPLAIGFEWARSIVEQFELVEIPKSPPWLLGACNVEGNIVPVVDLSIYLDPDNAMAIDTRTQRLLIGGSQGDNSENAIGLAFTGLPIQLRYSPQALPSQAGWPARLIDICTATARDAAGEMYLEIDAEKLSDALSTQLDAL